MIASHRARIARRVAHVNLHINTRRTCGSQMVPPRGFYLVIVRHSATPARFRSNAPRRRNQDGDRNKKPSLSPRSRHLPEFVRAKLGGADWRRAESPLKPPPTRDAVTGKRFAIRLTSSESTKTGCGDRSSAERTKYRWEGSPMFEADLSTQIERCFDHVLAGDLTAREELLACAEDLP